MEEEDWLGSIVKDYELINDDCLFSSAAAASASQNRSNVKLERSDEHDDLESFLFNNVDLLPSPDAPPTNLNESVHSNTSTVKSEPIDPSYPPPATSTTMLTPMAVNVSTHNNSNNNTQFAQTLYHNAAQPQTSFPSLMGPVRMNRIGTMVASHSSPYSRPGLVPARLASGGGSGLLQTTTGTGPRPTRLYIARHAHNNNNINPQQQPQRMLIPTGTIATNGYHNELGSDGASPVKSESSDAKSPSPPGSDRSTPSTSRTGSYQQSGTYHSNHQIAPSTRFTSSNRTRSKMHDLALAHQLISDQDLRSTNGNHVNLSPEEKRTLLSEGYPIPNKLPLTKPEQEALKLVRRKIKNKLSAQESRRKRKDYMENLEHRIENCQTENSSLRQRIRQLESVNRQLTSQVRRLKQQVGDEPGSDQKDTSSNDNKNNNSNQQHHPTGSTGNAFMLLFAISIPVLPLSRSAVSFGAPVFWSPMTFWNNDSAFNNQDPSASHYHGFNHVYVSSSAGVNDKFSSATAHAHHTHLEDSGHKRSGSDADVHVEQDLLFSKNRQSYETVNDSDQKEMSAVSVCMREPCGAAVAA